MENITPCGHDTWKYADTGGTKKVRINKLLECLEENLNTETPYSFHECRVTKDKRTLNPIQRKLILLVRTMKCYWKVCFDWDTGEIEHEEKEFSCGLECLRRVVFGEMCLLWI